MSRLVVLVVLAIEAAGLISLANYEGWRFVVGLTMLTGLLGILVIACMPQRWRTSLCCDDLDPMHVDESVEGARRHGIMLLMAGMLLILPGVISDLAGAVLLAAVVAGSCWPYRHRSGSAAG